MGKPHDIKPQNLLTRLNAEMLEDFYAAGFWEGVTIYGLARRHAASEPNRVAVSDSWCSLRYGELVELADRLAADLGGAGLRRGDRVAAWLSSRVEVAVFLLACSRNGYVFCPSLHRNHTVEEVAQLLGQMRARILVGEHDYGAGSDRQDIFEVAQHLDHMAKVYQLGSPAARDAQTIASQLGLSNEVETAPTGHADNVVYLAYTSGTTGDPKGVMHSNNTLLANARSLANDWQFDGSSIIYTLSPLSHNLGFGAMVLSFAVGARLILHDLPRGASLLKKLREVAASFIFGVPAHAIDLLAEIDKAGPGGLESVKGFRISGAAVPSIVVEKLLLCGIVPQSGYGMTEACSHHYTLPGDAPHVLANTCGRACAGYEVMIFSPDDQDVPLPVGQIGHIGGRGASLMLGYYNNQLATEGSFNRSGWFMTGDLGWLDESGYLQITGRIKDVIIRGGHNIYPAKIESLAMRHPQVERAAAIPVKDERLGERVCMVVMAKPGSSVDPQALLSHLHAEGLSKYDMPEFFLQVDEIPLSASGKIMKRVLVSPVSDGTLVPQAVRFNV